MSLVLRGIFLMRWQEIDWWLHDMGKIFPERWRKFVEFLPADERGDLMENYYRRLTDPSRETQLAAAKVWSRYEGSCCTLVPNPEFLASFENEETAWAVARIEAHYFRNNRFDPDDLLLRQVDRIRNIPAVIVQGRYDIVCPIATAYQLHCAWPEAEYIVAEDAGHSSRETGICRELVAATDRFRELPRA
jgi:proline iminopeptidase